MKSKIILIQYQVKCDRCGIPIRPGEYARVVMDERHGAVRFEHRRCPGALAVAVERKPVQPKLTNAMAMA